MPSADLSPFKLDIDELINEFAEGEFTSFADMKRVWLSRKFLYIYDASPSTNLTFFMQSLFAHAMGHMFCDASLSQRLGGLYCLYCLYETQPFKPPYKIYLSLGEVSKLRILVVDAKKQGIPVAVSVVKKMLEKNMFLFGAVDLNEGSADGMLDKQIDVQNTYERVAMKQVFADNKIEEFPRMDLGMVLDIDMMMKFSKDYAEAKKLAITESSKVVDVHDIQHISKDKLIGDVIKNISEGWNKQKEELNEQMKDGNFNHLLESQTEEEEQLQQLNDDEYDSDDDGIRDEFAFLLSGQQ